MLRTAHGLSPKARCAEALATEQSPGQLRRDAARAHALAALLGERVVLLGSSTGGTLSVWLSVQPWVRPTLAALVLENWLRGRTRHLWLSVSAGHSSPLLATPRHSSPLLARPPHVPARC